MKKTGIIIAVIGIVMAVAGVIMKMRDTAVSSSISYVGGSDGPTAVFVAGKIGDIPGNIGIVLGIILAVAGIYVFIKKR